MSDYRKGDNNKFNRTSGGFSLHVNNSGSTASNLMGGNFQNVNMGNNFFVGEKRYRDDNDKGERANRYDKIEKSDRIERERNEKNPALNQPRDMPDNMVPRYRSHGHGKGSHSQVPAHSISSIGNSNISSSPRHTLNVSFNRKREMVRKIIDNLSKFSTLNTEEFKLAYKNFSNQEFAKFFQVLANMEYATSLDSESFLGKNKEAISINDKILNYNPELIDEDERLSTSLTFDQFDINKIIIKKDIPLKNILKDDLISFAETLTVPTEKITAQPPTSTTISFKIFFDEFFKTVKKENLIDLNQFKHLIKMYSNFIYNNGIISFTKEDKLLLDFIIENSLSVNQIQNFYSICKYWLYEDFTNFEKGIKYDYADSDVNLSVSSMQLKRRYDSMLTEILNRIDNHKELFELGAWISLLSDLPRINDNVIRHLLNAHDKLIESNYEKIRKDCAGGRSLLDQLPHLRLMKNVYVKLRRPSSASQLILNKLLDLIKNSTDSYVITQAILFLISNIFNLGKLEQERIKEFAINQFRELVKITEGNESAIFSKYPLLLFLFQHDKELIYELPAVYSESTETVRNTIHKDVNKMLRKVLDYYHAEKLIKKCTEECLPLVMVIIDFLKPEMFNDKTLNDYKIIRRIKEYYDEYPTIDILLALVIKLPFRDFFKTDKNFVYERIKFFENRGMTENNAKIFSKMNAAPTSLLNVVKKDPLFVNFQSEITDTTFTDKILFYIFYYVLYVNSNFIKPREDTITSIEITNYTKNDLSMLLKYYKLLNTERFTENIQELLKILIAKIDQSGQIHYLLFLNFANMLLEYFGKEKENVNVKESDENVKSEKSGGTNVELNTLGELILTHLKDFINQNIQVSENYINDTIEFIKALPSKGKEVLLKHLDEKVKNNIRTKDFILFSDI